MKTILIIEDEPDTLNNLALMLEMEGFKTLVADNGRDGIELALQKLPDLILCDIMMPVLDGHGVITALRAAPSTVAIPLIFLTAKSDRADFRSGMNLGADDYLTKPASGEEVLKAIRSRIDRQIQQEQATLSRVEIETHFESPLPLQQRFSLTPRESEVLLWAAQGKTNSEISTILGNTEHTVKIHMGRIFEKIGVDNRNAATVAAIEVLSTPRL